MIVDGERIRLLKTNGLFKGVSESSLKPYLKPKYFFEAKEGEILYICGDKASELYLIVEGEVKIKFCESGDVKHKYLSDFFGEVEILNGGIRNSSAVANTDCVLFRIDSTEFKQLSSSNGKLAENLKHKEEVKKDNFTVTQTSDYQPQTFQDPENFKEKPSIESLENFDDDIDWTIEEDKL